MNKTDLIKQLKQQISQLLSEAEQAAHQAHLAAIDDQSVAETQYDTLAIEAAYLAEGQSKRIDLYKNELKQLRQLSLVELASQRVTLRAIVIVEREDGLQQSFWVLPVAGGQVVKYQEHLVTVLTEQAPLAQAMIGLCVDDEFEFTIHGKTHQFYIDAIY